MYFSVSFLNVENYHKIFLNNGFDDTDNIRKPVPFETLIKHEMGVKFYKTNHQPFSDPLSHGTLIL